jgi:hypothetical protein
MTYNGGNGSDEYRGEPMENLTDAFDSAATVARGKGVSNEETLEARIEVHVDNPHVSDYIVILKRPG